MKMQWRHETKIRENQKRSFEVPDFNFHIVSGGGYECVFFIETNGGDEVVVGVLYFFFFLAEVQVPNSESFVVRGRVEVLAVRMD